MTTGLLFISMQVCDKAIDQAQDIAVIAPRLQNVERFLRIGRTPHRNLPQTPPQWCALPTLRHPAFDPVGGNPSQSSFDS